MTDPTNGEQPQHRASLLRELARVRRSPSYRLGSLFTSTIRRPWLLPILPFRFGLLSFQIGLELIGKRAPPKTGTYTNLLQNPSSQTFLLFPTNGVGFGHFTRMYALARALRREDPDVVCIFFTTMPVLHVLYQERFITYHISGRKRLDGFEAREWNTIVEEMLRIVIEAHNPTTFVFDGAFPYRGMLEAIGDYENLRKIWVRRGTMKARSSIPVDSEDFFERIVVPGDVEDGEPTETGGELRVPPMLLLNPDESLGRIQARRTLGLATESKCVYVQLGAGNINDIDHDLGEVVHELLQRSECQIVIGESMLGARIPVDHERVRVLRDYPNSRFLQAFDAAVQAGGYNSFHEMRVAGIPTLFLPNAQTGMDDQERRCMTSVDEGWGVVRKRNDSRTMRQLIDEMFDLDRPSVRDIKNGSDVLAIELLRGD